MSERLAAVTDVITGVATFHTGAIGIKKGDLLTAGTRRPVNAGQVLDTSTAGRCFNGATRIVSVKGGRSESGGPIGAVFPCTKHFHGHAAVALGVDGWNN